MPGRGMQYKKPSLHGNPFEEFDVEYIWQPYQTFLGHNNGKVDVNYFKQYNNRLVIINFASEHWNNTDLDAYKQLADTDINFIILTHDPKKHQLFPRMFYYPFWYYTSLFFWVRRYPDTQNKNKTYSLGCLNGAPRTHRIANYLKLKKQPYWNKSCVSFYVESVYRDDDFKLTDEEQAEWEQVALTLPDKTSMPFEPVPKNRAHSDLAVPQLTDCYLHITTETTALPMLFTSEKTWKPIATATPFVMWGDVGAVNFLKSQGVDIYDDIIDHKYYDTEEDDRLRLNKLYEVIGDLVAQGVDKIYNQLSDRAVINQEKYFRGEFDPGYHNQIVNAINKYK